MVKTHFWHKFQWFEGMSSVSIQKWLNLWTFIIHPTVFCRSQFLSVLKSVLQVSSQISFSFTLELDAGSVLQSNGEQINLVHISASCTTCLFANTSISAQIQIWLIDASKIIVNIFRNKNSLLSAIIQDSSIQSLSIFPETKKRNPVHFQKEFFCSIFMCGVLWQCTQSTFNMTKTFFIHSFIQYRGLYQNCDNRWWWLSTLVYLDWFASQSAVSNHSSWLSCYLLPVHSSRTK